ncbi:MAG TPA: hypothetical protein VI137_06850 [Pseudolabrys sp.]
MKADVKSVAQREKEALEWAINYFRDEDCAADLEPADDVEVVALLMARGDYPERFDQFISGVISRAFGKRGPVRWDPRSTARSLCQLASTLMSKGDPLPKPLEDFIIDFLDDPNLENFPSASGRKKRPNTFRDLRIVRAINHIVGTWKFRATRARRKDPAKGLSAASIVKDALEKSGLHLTEDAVNKIWNGVKDDPWAVPPSL